MWRLLSAVRRGMGWPRKRSARVADEGALETAGEAGTEARPQAGPGWGGGLAALMAVARAPSLAVAACLACQAEEEEEEPRWTSGRRPRADEINHLMMHDSMRYRIYV